MKFKDKFKILFPGVIAGVILGVIVNSLAGVNTENIIPNIIGIVLSCAVPVLLNGIIVLCTTAKALDRELTVGEAFKRNISYVFVGSVIGLFYACGMINAGVILTEISELNNTINNTILGIVVSTMFGYFALVDYAKDVKYTKRTKSEKAKKTTKKVEKK